MTSFGFIILLVVAIGLAALALSRGNRTFERGIERAVEQLALLAPRFVCALIAAGFVAKLLPSRLIATYLGSEAGIWAILIATAVGFIVPAGPVIAFSVAAIFARAGASVPAVIAFVTSWSLFAAHRIFMYEVPLLGISFLRFRAASVLVVPILAGLIATLAGLIVTFEQPGHP